MEKLSVFIFIVRGGTLYKPDLTSALEGVTRDTIVVLASEFGIPLIEKTGKAKCPYCGADYSLTEN